MYTGQTDKRTDSGRTRLTLPVSVRIGAGLLWTGSAVWTTVSVHHVIGNWATSGVVTGVIESAYGLATIWFHNGRTRLSAATLIAALVPVVAALAYADYDMFGWVGLAFAAGPLIAEGGFLLAAHLSVDPTAPTAEQRAELAALLREAAHQAALRARTQADNSAVSADALSVELAEIRAEALRQMALDKAAAEVRLQRIDLARQLSLSAPDTDNRTMPELVSGTNTGQMDKRTDTGQTLSGQLSDTVRPADTGQMYKRTDTGQTDTGQTDTTPAVRPVSAPARLSAVRPDGLSGAVRSVLADNPEISNAELTERVSEILGTRQKADSVRVTRKRQQTQSA